MLEVSNGGERIDPTSGDAGRAVSAATFAVDGFGLGLSIVRSVAEAHGGSMRLTAPEAGGLRVVVTLPESRSEPHASGLHPAPAAEPRR